MSGPASSQARRLHLNATDPKCALAIFEKTLGPEHPQVAASLNSLAVLYDAQGRSVEAKPLFQRALSTQKPVPG